MELLSNFAVSKSWGLLNSDAGCAQLPPCYDDLLETARNMGFLLRQGQFRKKFNRESAIDVPADLTAAQKRLLWCAYGMLASSYVFSIYEKENALVLPRSLAIPLYKLSEMLGMPPILNYDAYVLCNFRQVLPDGDVNDPDTYAPLFTFSSPICDEYEGEKWFIVVHVAAERVVGPSIAKLLEMQHHLEENGDSEPVATFLRELADRLELMDATICRMQERLRTDLYAFTTRKYVFPFAGVIFDGVEELKNEPQHLRGETGGQSPVPRAVGAFLGLQHSCSDMADLGKHMLPEHQRYVEELCSGVPLKEYLCDRPELTAPYEAVVKALAGFRTSHLKLAATYLAAHSLSSGTGRSVFQTYLRANLNETRAVLA
jgi:indoleamine 2,3-dioxygenase